MTPERFQEISAQYSDLRIAIVGDFCLDRYLEIDPARQEISIETGLPVHNVTNVRSQPGAAGTILNNMVALGVGEIYPVGFCGEDGEGYELRRSLLARRGVKLDYFVETDLRRTFTYCKPLVMTPGKAPVELNRLDSKNWSATPAAIEDALIVALRKHSADADAIIALDQVDMPDTGVVTRRVRAALGEISAARPERLVLADSRQGLAGWPAVGLKMNAAELGALLGGAAPTSIEAVRSQAAELARRQARPVFVTLSERGIVGAEADGTAAHIPSLPVRGPIDIVGAGDSVTANLTSALAAGANQTEAMELAMAAANEVVHQLGTTGTANPAQLRARLAL